MNLKLLAPLAFLTSALSSPAAPITFASGPAQAALIELYTSEGCSSCPPAEAWISSLKKEPGLWKSFVPITFHVNYWDDLGWPDKLASPAYTQRQRDYAAHWGTGTIYTPGFVLDGREWRAGRNLPAPSSAQPGILSIRIEGQKVHVEFAAKGTWEAHLALLGSGFTSHIGGGENSGRTLHHDFVALDLQSALTRSSGPKAVAEFTLPVGKTAPQFALAAWVTAPHELAPIQATGGALP